MKSSTEYVSGVKVNFDLSVDDILKEIDSLIRQESARGAGRETPSLISTTNAEFIMDAQKDEGFKQIINNSTFSIPDGVGIIYAREYLERVKRLPKDVFFPVTALFLGLMLGLESLINWKKFDGRISGRELIYKMCKLAEEKNYSVFLLGGWKKNRYGKMEDYHGDVAGLAAKKLMQKFPKLNVVGAASEFSYKAEDDEITIQYIHKCMHNRNVSKIDMLFVAYNHIRQERWVVRNAGKIPAKVSMGVGGTLDYIAGTYKIPPKLMINHNLEWLYKLIVQPWRAKRILNAFPRFPIFIYKTSIKDK